MYRLMNYCLIVGLLCCSSVFTYATGPVPLDNSKHLHAKIHKGQVAQVIQTDKYTYIEVVSSKRSEWAAVSKQDIQKGETVSFDLSNGFDNFKSKSLNRTFKTLYLISKLHKDNTKKIQVTPKVKSSKKAFPIMSKVKKADFSIAELFQQKNQLKDKPVSVRGIIVKATLGVMGMNWFHIQDGTSHSINQSIKKDLTITTQKKVFKVGDKVLVKGNLTVGKDLGHGYVYDLIVEKANIVLE